MIQRGAPTFGADKDLTSLSPHRWASLIFISVDRGAVFRSVVPVPWLPTAVMPVFLPETNLMQSFVPSKKPLKFGLQV